MSIAALLIVAALSAAAQEIAAPAEGEILVVDEEQLDRMWRVVRSPAPRYEPAKSKGRDGACVTIGFVVEADGTTSSLRVLRSHPPGALDQPGLAAIARWRFAPGPDNQARAPVYSTGSFTLNRARGASVPSDDAARAHARCAVDIVPPAAAGSAAPSERR